MKFHAILLNDYGERPLKRFDRTRVYDDLYHTCTFAPNFAVFVLLTRRCYDPETSVILLLLNSAFA